MLYALGVGLRGLARRADGDEEIDHQPVALVCAFGHRRARFGQKYAAIWLRPRQTLALQAGDGLAGGRVGDAKPARDVGRARLAVGRDQIGDQFGIVLEHRGRAGRARLAEAVGLRGLRRKRRGSRRRPLAALPGRQVAPSLAPRKAKYPCRFHSKALAAQCNLARWPTASSSLCALLQPIDYAVAMDTLWS